MKIAFSTLGCPDFSWTDIYPMAKDFHFDGIEIRGPWPGHLRRQGPIPSWARAAAHGKKLAELHACALP